MISLDPHEAITRPSPALYASGVPTALPVSLDADTLRSLRGGIARLRRGDLSPREQRNLAALVGERAWLLLEEVDRCRALLEQCLDCGGDGKCVDCRSWSDFAREHYRLGEMAGCRVCGDTVRCRGCKGSGKVGE